MSHYIVFNRTMGHSAAWTVRANTVNDALLNYAAHERGRIDVTNGIVHLRNGTTYRHIMEMIEAEFKSHRRLDELQLSDDGSYLLNNDSWQISLVSDKYRDSDCGQVLCGYECWSVAGYIELARGVFRKKYPRSRARAFVWYLDDGPLVTFYKKSSRNFAVDRIEVLGRYLQPWDNETWKTPQFSVEWHGGHDDIVNKLNVDPESHRLPTRIDTSFILSEDMWHWGTMGTGSTCGR